MSAEISSCGDPLPHRIASSSDGALRETTGGFTLSLWILAGGLVLAAVVFQVVLGRWRT